MWELENNDNQDIIFWKIKNFKQDKILIKPRSSMQNNIKIREREMKKELCNYYYMMIIIVRCIKHIRARKKNMKEENCFC